MAMPTTAPIKAMTLIPLIFQCENCGKEIQRNCMILVKDEVILRTGRAEELQEFLPQISAVLEQKIEDADRRFNHLRDYQGFYVFFKNERNEGAGICPICGHTQFWYDYAAKMPSLFGKNKRKKQMETWLETVDPPCVPRLCVERRTPTALVD